MFFVNHILWGLSKWWFAKDMCTCGLFQKFKNILFFSVGFFTAKTGRETWSYVVSGKGLMNFCENKKNTMARFFRVTMLFFFDLFRGWVASIGEASKGHLDHYTPICIWWVRTWDRAWRSVCDRRVFFSQQRNVRGKCELKMFKDKVWRKWSEDLGMTWIHHHFTPSLCRYLDAKKPFQSEFWRSNFPTKIQGLQVINKPPGGNLPRMQSWDSWKLFQGIHES